MLHVHAKYVGKHMIDLSWRSSFHRTVAKQHLFKLKLLNYWDFQGPVVIFALM